MKVFTFTNTITTTTSFVYLSVQFLSQFCIVISLIHTGTTTTTTTTTYNAQQSMHNPMALRTHTNQMNNSNHHRLAPRQQQQQQRWRPNRHKPCQPRHNRIHYDRSKQRKPYQPLPRFTGTLKSFNAAKQYGFIQYCPDNQSNKQIFVHQSEFLSTSNSNIPNLIYHQSLVQFDVFTYYDNKTGVTKEKAQNVRIVHNTPPRPTKPPLPNNANRRRHVQLQTDYEGTLNWFSPEKHHGFIECDAQIDGVSDDLFVHESALQFDAQRIFKKMRLIFCVEHYIDHRGNAQVKAINVRINEMHSNSSSQNRNVINNRLLNVPSPPPRHSRLHYAKSQSTPKMIQIEGYLQWFNFDKKHGFIKCDDTQRDDVFVYLSEFMFPKDQIRTGMRLLFEIKEYVDANGQNKRKAINVLMNHSQPLIAKNETIETAVERQMEEKIEENPSLNANANVFVPSAVMPTVIVQSTKSDFSLTVILECDEDSEDALESPKHKNKFKKQSILDKLFCGNDNCEKIARKLYEMYVKNEQNYCLETVFNELYHLDDEYKQSSLFLSVILEFFSLIELNESILSVIKHVFDGDICDKYLSEMILIESMSDKEIFAEFEEYGLQCIYPSDIAQNELIKRLMDENCSATEFVTNECFKCVNYALMCDILEYLIPKYVANKTENYEIFEFVALMVENAEYCDLDNNNKYVALSVIFSVFAKYKLWNELEPFLRELIDSQIIKYDVVDKWKWDDYDAFSQKYKKRTLSVLSNVIFELQNREIIENMISDLQTETETESDYCDSLCNQYIDSRDLLQPNTNRCVSLNRCPWKYSDFYE